MSAKIPNTYMSSLQSEIERMDRCILRMAQSNSFDAYEDAWVHFLESAANVKNKTCELKKVDCALEAKDELNKLLLGYLDSIKKNPWLNYVLEARNQQVHSIQIISSRLEGKFSISSRGSTWIQSISRYGNNFHVEYEGTRPDLQLLPNRIELLPVKDRKQRIVQPPFRDCYVETGQPLHVKCKEAAEFHAGFAEMIVAKFFAPSQPEKV
jgi:hypothetical protein